MKDNAAWVWLLVCGLPLAAFGQVRVNGNPNNQGQFFINGQQGLFLQYDNSAAVRPELMPDPRSDVVEFVDGSILHGQMERMDLEHGLTWVNPEAKSPINFRSAHLDFIRFAHARSLNLAPTCHLWFANGDDLYGSVTSLDNEHLGFHTWFGGAMDIPRAAGTRDYVFVAPLLSHV